MNTATQIKTKQKYRENQLCLNFYCLDLHCGCGLQYTHSTVHRKQRPSSAMLVHFSSG